MSMTFGYDIATGDANDRYVDLAEHILAVIPELLQPGRNMINVFPFLRFIPPWFPGASTQKSMVQVKELWMAYKTEPYEYVKSNLVYIYLHYPSLHQLKILEARRDIEGLHVNTVTEMPSER